MHFAMYNTRNKEGDAGTFIYFLVQTKNLKGEVMVVMKNRLHWQKLFLRENRNYFYTYQNKETNTFSFGKDQKYVPVFHLILKLPLSVATQHTLCRIKSPSKSSESFFAITTGV